MSKSSKIFAMIVAGIFFMFCCLIVVLVAIYYSIRGLEKPLLNVAAKTTATYAEQTPSPIKFTRPPENQIPAGALKLLQETNVPSTGRAELVCRFKGICNVPPTLAPPAEPLDLSARQTFWVLNIDTHTTSQVEATLKYITPHSYFWVADSVNFKQEEIKKLMDAFENKIYPTDRALFGSEWTPGVDDDPHISVLYTGGLGHGVGGGFNSNDEYPPQIYPYSNAHEMFYISSTEPLSDSYTFGSLAHELQHMIHWYQDPNETSFLDEGFSELAAFINGYTTGVVDQLYLTEPDLNLTDWLPSASVNYAHYGASFLFATYLLDRFGEQSIKDLIHNPKRGMDGIDDTLAQDHQVDPLTDKVITADDFYLDWTIANFVQDRSVADGRYYYHDYPNAPKAEATESISNCPMDSAPRTVNQFGVNYIRITCSGMYTLRFEGTTSTSLLPVDPHSGKYSFWSNKGDSSDMTLTREFDLTGITNSVRMDYWTWYDIEKDYDYVYVEASTDDQHWSFLKTPSGTESNPNGSSFGWGYTGQSDGWIQESADLSMFAGKKVYIRFEYLTDQAVNGEGFLLDDVTIRAINYATDFEKDNGGWEADGFARIENSIPQTFRLALITHAADRTMIQIIPTMPDQSASIPLAIGQDGIKDVVLVVTGTNRFTRMLASYQFNIH